MRSREQLALGHDFEKWILAIVSHDIRNPLSAIRLAARGLKDVADPAGVVAKLAEIVARGVERIQHITGDLLDLSQERAGSGISVEPALTDLRAICRQVIDELVTIAPDRSITLVCDTDSRGMWDRHRILQVLSNLVSNAVQHGAPASPVLVRLTGDDRSVVVEVRNEGVIPRELLPRLFEPFSSLRRRERGSEGLGLGLFIAKAIARAHDGELDVDSSDGVTTSRLLLPRRRGEA